MRNMAQSRNDTDITSEVNTEETCTLMLQAMTVAELKHVLRQFGCPLGGKKSVLQSRALGTLRLRGSNKMEAAIQQIPRISQKLDTLRRLKIVGPANRDPAPAVYPNPCQHVKFKEATFYTNIDTLVNSTPLVAKNRKNSLVMSQESVKISLTASQAAGLKLSEKIGNDDKAKVFVHLRFCENIPDEPQDDCCPSFCDIGVKLHYDYYPISLNGEKISAPVDITSLFSMSKSSTQVTLLIRWFNKSTTTPLKEFVYCVTMVKRRVIEDVVKKIPIISAADTRARIKAKLSAFRSNEVSSSGQQLSFQCPLSMSRLKDPCRGVNCKHLQCFDACSYLKLNRTKPRWICPVCQQNVPFSELEIDGLQLEILRHSTIVKIEFDADGCWHPILNDNRKRVVSIDDDDYVEPLLKKKSCGDKLDVIDLTNDSSSHTIAATTTIVL